MIEIITLSAFRRDICVVRVLCLLAIVCSVVILIYGCRGKKSDYISPNEMSMSSDEMLPLVRSVVMKQSQRLSDEEKGIILRSVPKTAQYKMAGTFGQYIWSWDLPKGRMIEVKYVGDSKSPIDTEKITVLFSNK